MQTSEATHQTLHLKNEILAERGLFLFLHILKDVMSRCLLLLAAHTFSNLSTEQILWLCLEHRCLFPCLATRETVYCALWHVTNVINVCCGIPRNVQLDKLSYQSSSALAVWPRGGNSPNTNHLYHYCVDAGVTKARHSKHISCHHFKQTDRWRHAPDCKMPRCVFTVSRWDKLNFSTYRSFIYLFLGGSFCLCNRATFT